jgi:hypothetical protein
LLEEQAQVSPINLLLGIVAVEVYSAPVLRESTGSPGNGGNAFDLPLPNLNQRYSRRSTKNQSMGRRRDH